MTTESRRHRSTGNLNEKVAIVTGSGRGIGREVALKLAAEGAAVVVNDVDTGPATETVDTIRREGGRAALCVGSVTEDGFAEKFVTVADDEFGALDIIVNNAGYTWDSVIQKMGDDQWDAIIDVHLKAPFRVLRAAQPLLVRGFAEARKAGTRPPCRKVVNISSIAGLDGNAGQANYAAAKAGVTGLTKALAKEWGRYNITVNTVAFGLITTRLTDATASEGSTISVADNQIKVGLNPDQLDMMERMIPLGRAGTSAEAAGAVYLFCLPESDYISGQTVVCGGGLRL